MSEGRGRRSCKRKGGWDGALRKQAKRRALKPGIWSNTPHDLHPRILKFLPITSLCRFRCVSKTWSSATPTTISSNNASTFISLIGKNGLRILGGTRWKEFTLAAIPEKAPFVSYLSTSAGLVLATHSHHVEWLSVHNPFVSRCSRVLGPLTDIRGDINNKRVAFAGIQALRSSVTSDGRVEFAVVCVTYIKVAQVHVYDSRSWSWVVECARIPGLGYEEMETLYMGRENQHTLLLKDDLLYFLTISRNNNRSLWSLNIWDPEHTCKTLATWTDLPLNLHQNPYDKRCECNHPSLIFSQGEFMLVNVTPEGRVGFVRLEQEGRKWREVAWFSMEDLPASVKRRNSEERWSPGYVWAVGTPHGSEVVVYFALCQWGCIFDVARSSWRPVPTEDMFHPFHPSFLRFDT